MANRNFNDMQALEKEVKKLYAEIAIGASGAPTLTAGLGISSVSRNAAGDYTLTLADNYDKLLGFNGIIEDTSAEDITFQIDTEAVASGTIDFYTKTADTATDPSDGSSLWVEVTVRNTSVGPA